MGDSTPGPSITGPSVSYLRLRAIGDKGVCVGLVRWEDVSGWGESGKRGWDTILEGLYSWPAKACGLCGLFQRQEQGLKQAPP